MLKRLLAGGWVKRRQDEYDYRISRAYLTDWGVALRDAIAEQLRQIDASLQAELGEVDTQTLESLLDQAGDAFRAVASGASPITPVLPASSTGTELGSTTGVFRAIG